MRYSNRVIRQFLRRLKRPAALEVLPLAQALRQALGTDTVFEAAQLALKNAFEACGPAGEGYRRIIWAYDVERRVTRDEAARELSVSPRHFYRLRAEAVQAFSDYVERVLAGPIRSRDHVNDAAHALLELDPGAASELLALTQEPDIGNRIDVLYRMAVQMNDLETIDLSGFDGLYRVRALLVLSYVADVRGEHAVGARIRDEARRYHASLPGEADPRVAFEIATIEFTAARNSGTAISLLERAETAAHLAEQLGGEHSILGLTLLAEAAILAGLPARAREAIDIAFYSARENRHYRALGFALLRQAQLDVLENRLENALRLARASEIALRSFPDGRLFAMETVGRITTILGRPWAPEELDPSAVEGSVWLRLALAGVALRNSLTTASGEISGIRRAAEVNARRASDQGYIGLAAFSFATAALAAGKMDLSEANDLLLQAWRLLAQSENHLLAFDIFALPGRAERDFGPLAFEDGIAAAISQTLAQVGGIGSIGLADAQGQMSRVWPLILATAAGKLSTAVPIENAQEVARELARQGVTATTFERISRGALRTLVVLTGALLLPDERPQFERRLTRTLRAFQYNVERCIARERFRMASHLSAS
jgi:hypothetical protein